MFLYVISISKSQKGITKRKRPETTEYLNIEDRISMEMNKDREYWLRKSQWPSRAYRRLPRPCPPPQCRIRPADQRGFRAGQ